MALLAWKGVKENMKKLYRAMKKNVRNGIFGLNGHYVLVHVEVEPVRPDGNALAVIAVKTAAVVMNFVSNRATWIHVYTGLNGTTGPAVNLFVRIEIA